MNPIAIIAKLTGLDEAAARLVGWAALAFVLVAAGAFHAVSATWDAAERVEAAHEAGVAAGKASEHEVWRVAADEERQRQARANAEAVAASEQTAAALRRERDDLAQTLEDLTHAVDSDPDRDRECLDPGSVRRLDGFR
jgi:hypothetical protein